MNMICTYILKCHRKDKFVKKCVLDDKMFNHKTVIVKLKCDIISNPKGMEQFYLYETEIKIANYMCVGIKRVQLE